MSIHAFIQSEVLLPRMKKAGALVVYDPAGRYRDLCLAMNGDDIDIVDASDSSIESREAASKAFLTLGSTGDAAKNLLVYVPASPPLSEEDRQQDPFSVYTVCGSVFPDGAGDEYQSLCLRAKPDYATELRKLFADNPDPEFSIIDNVGGGTGWPELCAILDRKGPRELVYALLVPTATQREALDGKNTWVAEAKDFLKATLGLSLKTRAKSWRPIADELWRFMLYSEFVFDLPGDLPPSLTNVPCADEAARPLIDDLCDRLRNDRTAQTMYIERAESIEKELSLADAFAGVTELGNRDTFPFEEQSFFRLAVTAIEKGETEEAHATIYRHASTVWVGKGESQAKWGLVRAALELIETCEDNDRQLSRHAGNQEALLDYYVESLREVDRLQREFERAVGDVLEIDETIDPIISKARARYRKISEKVQGVFTEAPSK